MLRYALLAGVMTVATPALAQQTTNTAPGQATQQAAPAATPQNQTPAGSPATDPQPVPATAMDSATTATDAQTAKTQPAAGADQVAAVVDAEFPTYDANKDGQLEKAEFASWMVKLKQANDPKVTATDPKITSWVNSAFAQADTDKSKSVSKPELIAFLSHGQS